MEVDSNGLYGGDEGAMKVAGHEVLFRNCLFIRLAKKFDSCIQLLDERCDCPHECSRGLPRLQVDWEAATSVFVEYFQH